MSVDRRKHEVEGSRQRTDNRAMKRVTFDSAGRLQIDGRPALTQETKSVGQGEEVFRIEAMGGPKRNHNCRSVELSDTK